MNLRWREGAWFAMIAALIAGCSTAPPRQLSRSAPDGVYVQGGRIPFQADETAAYSEQGGLIAVLERKHGRPLQILELSGGGQYGAFGAGFLNGWTEGRGRPRFDIVTGISTGALLSTFAFLGTPEDDATLAEIFTGVNDEDIYRNFSISQGTALAAARSRMRSGNGAIFPCCPIRSPR